MNGMAFLFLTILCSVAIAIILKVNEGRSGDRLVAAGANYVVAALLGLIFRQGSLGEITWGTVGAGATVGVGFVCGFLLLMVGIERLGLAIPASVARLSMLLPTVASLLLYHEHPSPLAIAGIALGVASFLLLGSVRGPGGEGRGGGLAIIIAIFVVSGCTDISLKVAQQSGLAHGPFLTIVFAAAAVLCWICAAASRREIRGRDLILGGILGVPNFFSGYFLILTLDRVPASVVFPAISAGVVVAVTLAALLFWKEHPTRRAWIGILLAALAVALLGEG